MSSSVDNKACSPGNWVEEIPRLLELWSAQINAAIGESHTEMETISQSYFSIAKEVVEAQQDDTPEALERTKRIQEQVNTAMVKFQVTDRLMQRLQNVQTNLLVLGEFFEKNAGSGSAESWQQTLATIKSGYTMAAERRMFDAALHLTEVADQDAAELEKTGCRLSLF